MFLSDLSIRRPVFTIILSALLLLFGAIAWPRLPVNQLPEVESPFVTISVVYPGADPEVIENRVLKPIEDAVSTISGIKKIRSTGVDSFGFVMLEFEMDVNADTAAQDVRDRVATVKNVLPSDAKAPVVQKFQVGARPVVSLVLTAPAGARPSEITHVAEKRVKERLQQIRGVGTVDIVGRQEREIHVIADPAALMAYGLTLPDIQKAIAFGNMDVPGGHVVQNGIEFNVKTHAEARTLDQLRSLVIAAPAGAPIRLGDVARVVDSEEEARTRSAFDGVPAMSLLVRKQSGANTVAVSEAIQEAIAKHEIDLPPGYQLQVVQDASTFTKKSIHDVTFDLIFGAFLAVVVILLFLRDGRATFISAMALPVSVVSTFAFMLAMNFTVNVLTMLALSLSIGMLIDDAIVVIENIHRHLEMGKPPRQAAADATREIGLAVLATTLSIVAVFVPVAFMKGLIGRFFYEFGLTVAFAVVVSMFVSFTFTPMASARLLRELAPGPVSKAIGRGLDALDRWYRSTLGWVLRHRALTLLVGFLSLAGAIALARYIPSEFQPAMDRGELDITFSMPEGTSLDATFATGQKMQREVLAAVPLVRHMLLTVGTGQNKKVNEGKIFVKLPPASQRKESQDQIMLAIRQRLRKQMPGVLFAVNPSGMDGNEEFSRDLVIQLRGNNGEHLRKAANRLRDAMAKDGHFVGISVSDRGSKPQEGFEVLRDKVSAAGLAPAQVAMAIRTAINGAKASQFRVGADRYDVVVMAPESYRNNTSRVLGMSLRGPMHNMVQVGELVQPKKEGSPAQLDRENRERKVTILANLQGIALGQARSKVQQLARGVLPRDVSLHFGGKAELMKESFGYMIEALLLAVALIYMVLAAQFESFIHPFTIMISLPLALIGALGALLVTRQTLSIMSFIGIIMLMGLVTKNAILLVDNANQARNREKPAGIREAIIEAGSARLRPILMTTSAMIFGMLPVAIGMGEGAEIRRPMGVAVIGGLLTSTMLTLLVVPVVYDLLERLNVRLKGKRQQMSNQPTALPGSTSESTAGTAV